MKKQTLQCTHCVLDSNDDPAISFDGNGVCNYCREYATFEDSIVIKGEKGAKRLKELVANIKEDGKGKPYDSILGLSGGVDSSYVALKASQLGLRPLVVHFDNGWNSELAVKNIESIIKKLNFDLHTLVVDWEEFRDLQLAFIRASVVDIEIVTDHAILATLYKLAIKYRIKYILSGTNYVTEAILPPSWIHPKGDYIHIKALQKKWVGKPFRTYPLLDAVTRIKADLSNIQTVSMLNYLDFNKDAAKQEMIKEFGWRDYGGKHYESVFTRFYQGYILPRKFGIDKRKAHLATLICSGQITRDMALEELAKPVYDEALLRTDYDFVIKKLGLSQEAFDVIMKQPVCPHGNYPVERGIYEKFPALKIIRPMWHWVKFNLLKK
jgi:N-acetyl sugar amidotransferase